MLHMFQERCVLVAQLYRPALAHEHQQNSLPSSGLQLHLPQQNPKASLKAECLFQVCLSCTLSTVGYPIRFSYILYLYLHQNLIILCTIFSPLKSFCSFYLPTGPRLTYPTRVIARQTKKNSSENRSKQKLPLQTDPWCLGTVQLYVGVLFC